MIETYLLNYKKLKFILNEARQNDNDEDRLSYFISISVYITQIQLFMINSLINKSQPFQLLIFVFALFFRIVFSTLQVLNVK